jgi:hypothetical protein
LQEAQIASALFLLGLLFDPEEVGDMFLGTLGFLQTTRPYNPKERPHHTHSNKNPKSNK